MKISQEPTFKQRWDNIVNQAQLNLSHLFIDRLNEQYTTVKEAINTSKQSLSDACVDSAQFEEMTTALVTNYKRAAAVKSRPDRRRRPAPRGRQQRQQRGRNINMLFSVLKAIKNIRN